jgi:hypothetical protein
MAQSNYGRGSEQITDLKDKASEQFSRAAEQAEGMANRVAEQGREAGERMGEVAENFKGALDRQGPADGHAGNRRRRRLRAWRALEVVASIALLKRG